MLALFYMLELFLPRHLEIIYHINFSYLEAVRKKFPADMERIPRKSWIEEYSEKKVNMANFSVVVHMPSMVSLRSIPKSSKLTSLRISTKGIQKNSRTRPAVSRHAADSCSAIPACLTSSAKRLMTCGRSTWNSWSP